MNVVIAGYQAVSILHGGPNTQIRNTAKHLASYDVSVRFFDPWSTFTPKDVDLFHLFAANLGTYHLAREIHALGIPLAVSPIVYSNHSPRFIAGMLRLGRLVQKTGLGLWSDYIFTADILRWAHLVLPNSKAEGELVEQGFHAHHGTISLIPNGVDERFGEADPTLFKKTYGLEGFVLNVGHIGHGRKNVLNLIKALAGIDYPAVIIGRIIRGPYGDACVREAAKHKHILLIDGLDNGSPMLASAYAACDVFALPSLFETPGIAALEAGLAGAKIVITPYGGTREYFGEMATYVEPGSVASIRRGIQSALQDKRSAALSQHIRRNYLWPRVAELTAAAYRAALGRS
ncbi:MAG TPA: glycosyltransferase family 4 protein [Bacteroidota bacterium]|nr:glycosyltransferase family 4 protein [Bacteroidota bacterium]